ncbi:MAG: pyridoxamine 5'-phosphate oxidase family protein [bacterium]
MTDLTRLLQKSASTAGPAIAATFNKEERALTVEEFRAFWRATRMFAVATGGEHGAPHIAPVHVLLEEGDVFRMSIFEDSARLRDLRRDPRIAVTTWGDDGTIVILYGRCSEAPDSRRELSRGGQSDGRAVIAMTIEPTRIHVMCPRPRGERTVR